MRIVKLPKKFVNYDINWYLEAISYIESDFRFTKHNTLNMLEIIEAEDLKNKKQTENSKLFLYICYLKKKS